LIRFGQYLGKFGQNLSEVWANVIKIWKNLIRFGPTQNFASPKAFDPLSLC